MNSRDDLKVPFIRLGECLHGVGSYNQTMFPQNVGMSASFDADIVHRVGRAIGTEARSIGVHACLSPVLDIATEPRWGRAQEGWGEDHILTSHMGVAYASGLSKNGSWSDPDAVIPVMKHFAAHGSPQAGRNAASWRGRGTRQILQDELRPFKAAVQLGGVRGVMMAYSELDDVPAHVSPILYDALKEWGYDGFVMADDTGMIDLMGKSLHLTTKQDRPGRSLSLPTTVLQIKPSARSDADEPQVRTSSPILQPMQSSSGSTLVDRSNSTTGPYMSILM